MPNRLGVARTLPRLPVLITIAGFVPATVWGPVTASAEAIVGMSAAATTATRMRMRGLSVDMASESREHGRRYSRPCDSQRGGLVQELEDAPLQLSGL